MTWWQIALLVWVGVGAALFVFIRIAIRHEPTAHGQIVGRQIAWVFAIGWPVLIPLIIVSAVVHWVGSLRS